MTLLSLLVLSYVVPLLVMATIVAFAWGLFGRTAAMTVTFLLAGGAMLFLWHYSFGDDPGVVEHAVRENDPAICDRLLPELFMPVEDPREDCVREVAVRNRNTDACELLMRKRECYAAIAKEYQDVSACDAAPNVTVKTECYMFAIDDVPFVKERLPDCALVPELSIREQCHQTFARATNDVSLCKDVVTIFAIQRCREHFGARYVLGDPDVICPRQAIGWPEWCYRFFAIHTNKPNLCEKVSNEQECRDAVSDNNKRR